MAVYTPLLQEDIAAFLTRYELGKLDSFKGIAEGVSNTNYLLVLQDTKYILTLFEAGVQIEDLPYFTSLMEWWRAQGISCPEPIKMKDGRVLSALSGKPALLVSFLEGEGVTKITPEHLLHLGKLAADMHLSGQNYPHSRANALSISGWDKMCDDIGERHGRIQRSEMAARINKGC